MCLLLAEHYPALLGGHAPALLQALSGAVQDPSSALLRKVMAATTARVAVVAPQASVERLLAHARKLYLKSGKDGARLCALRWRG